VPYQQIKLKKTKQTNKQKKPTNQKTKNQHNSQISQTQKNCLFEQEGCDIGSRKALHQLP